MNDTQLLVNAAYVRTTTDVLRTLPSWFEQFRPMQADAVNQIVDAYARGVRIVVLDAPTGAGKTLIAETVRRLVGGSALYVCNTKTLQEQFCHDYSYAALLKGRNNYPTWDDELPVTAADCNFSSSRPCSWCPSKPACPYEVAKLAGLRNRLTVLNTAYFLGEGNGPGTFKGRGLAVLDEADTLENTVMGYVGLQIGKRRAEKLGLGEPTLVTKQDSWLEWVEEAIPLVDGQVPVLSNDDRDVDKIRDWNYLTRLAGELRTLRKSLAEGGWVYTGKDGRIEFKPVRVDTVSPVVVWPLAQRFLLMSATMISPEAELGWHGWQEPYEVVRMSSSFPVEGRRIKVVSCADMSKKANEVDKLYAGIAKVLTRHPDESVLIHTVSYMLAKAVTEFIKKSCRRTVVSYDDASKRDTALDKFRRKPGSVLVASSMDRGVDLPDDLCRVVIVAKMPFPYLGDRQVNARLYGPGGQEWYRCQAIRTLVQMTGRATRHKDDYSVSYILDSQFDRVWGTGRRLFPSWWTEALEWRDRLADVHSEAATGRRGAR